MRQYEGCDCTRSNGPMAARRGPCPTDEPDETGDRCVISCMLPDGHAGRCSMQEPQPQHYRPEDRPIRTGRGRA